MAGVVGMPTLPEGYRFILQSANISGLEYVKIDLEKQHKRWFGSEWNIINSSYAEWTDDAVQMAESLFNNAERMKQRLMAKLDKEKLIKEFNDSSN